MHSGSGVVVIVVVEVVVVVRVEAPEVYCVESNYVACYLPNTDYKFKVHHRCWGQWEFRDRVVVTAYRSQRHHLINNTPSHNCAYCQQDIYYIDLASNCDICALLQNV